MSQHHQYDVLVIGSGAAGLTLALNLPESLRIGVLSKGDLANGSTYWAQGGVAAVLDDTDTVESHVADTLIAGGGLCHEEAVRFTVEHSREAIQWLIEQGVPFTREEADRESGSFEYHLTREGGHSHRRIIHAADATGAAIFNTLLARTQKRSNIDLLHQRVAVDLITERKLGLPGKRCLGAYVLDRSTGEVDTFQAKFVVLATGGAAKVYLYTSNPDGACGDGIAMAWRAGCRVGNLEFNQFHPTCLYHPQAKSFLITEALRGEAQLNGSQQWLALNIEAGVPVIDSANSGQFIPQATNLQALGGISFKKGCYTGQEMVARAKFRGANKRALWYLAGTASRVPEAGEDLEMKMGDNWRRTGTVLAAVQLDDGRLLVPDSVFRVRDDANTLSIEPLPYSLEE